MLQRWTSNKQQELHTGPSASGGFYIDRQNAPRSKIFTKLGVCIEYVSTVQACIVALFPKQYKFSLHYTEDYKLLIDVQKQ